MANIRSINGNPIVLDKNGIADGVVDDTKLAQASGVLDRLYSVVENTVTRNGSAGNIYNANYVAIASVITPTSRYYKFVVDAPLDEGMMYKWNVRTYIGYFRDQYFYTSTNYFQYEVDLDNVSTLSVAVTLVNKEDLTETPIRIATVGTDFIHVIRQDVPDSVQEAVDDFGSVQFRPTLRNGTINNTGNADFICSNVFIPTADSIELTADVEISDEERLVWAFMYYDASYTAYETVFPEGLYDGKSVSLIVGDCKSYPYFKFYLGVYNESKGSYRSLRVADVGNDCVTVRRHPVAEAVAENEKWLFRPLLLDGSLGNPSNSEAVRTFEKFDVDGCTHLMLEYLGEMDDDEFPAWLLMTYDEDGNVVRSKGAGTSGDWLEYCGQAAMIQLHEGETRFRVGLFLFNQTASSSNPSRSLRMLTSQKCIRVTRVYVPKQDTGIVARNADVLPAVNAASKYGHNRQGVQNAQKCLSLLVTTDVHRDNTRMANALEYLNAINSIDCGICLGDIAAENYSESDGSWYTNIVNTSKKPFYTVIGNHDGGNSASASISGTKAQVFAKWIEPTLGVMGIDDLTTTYYKVDFSAYGVSLIVLDNYDVPDDLVQNSDFAVSRAVEAISQAQLNWFVSALEEVPSGYNLVIARHSCGCGSYTADYDRVFTQAERNVDPSYMGYDSDPIPPIVNAWVNGGSVSATLEPSSNYKTVLPTLNISADFGGRGVGKFACYLVGHTHCDIIARENTYGHLIMSLCTTANDNYQSGGSDLPRTVGTKAEDCITVFVVDTYRECINLVRVGSNITMTMKERTMESIPYTEG